MGEEIQRITKELGLEFSVMQETEGELAAKKLPDMLQLLLTGGLPTEVQCGICSAYKTWTMMCLGEPGNCAAALLRNLPLLMQVVERTLLLPDDADWKTRGSSYDDVGVQSPAMFLVDPLTSYCSMGAVKPELKTFALQTAPHAFRVLAAVIANRDACPVKDPTSFKPDGPAVKRAETVKALMQCTPSYTGPDFTLGDIPDALPILTALKELPAASVQQQATSLFDIVARFDVRQKQATGKVAAVIADARAGKEHALATLLDASLYQSEPEAYHTSLDVILAGNANYYPTILGYIAAGKPEVLVPHAATLVDRYVRWTGMQGVDTQLLMALKAIAPIDPRPVLAQQAAMRDRALANAAMGGDTTFAMLLGACGRGVPAGAEADALAVTLLELLGDPRLGPHAPPVVLSEILNLGPKLSSPAVLKPHLPAIEARQGQAAALVERLKDFIADRSLEKLEKRVDELEAKIEAMNQKVKETCFDFEQVKEYVDRNVRELKDFVGEVAKRLPTPQRLTVVGGLRKTLVLHFVCARTGTEFTTESKDWNKWLKMGFSLIKLGKCALDVGTGNPLGLLKTGIDCVKDVYAAYKERDDAEFNQYITQPFLTSQEQDHLLTGLRAAGFFDKFGYDSQLADWVCLAAIGAEDAAAIVAKQAGRRPDPETAVAHVKGKNLGLGSAKDIVSTGVAIAGHLGFDAKEMAAEAITEATEEGVDGAELIETAEGAAEVAGIAKEEIGNRRQQQQQPAAAARGQPAAARAQPAPATVRDTSPASTAEADPGERCCFCFWKRRPRGQLEQSLM